MGPEHADAGLDDAMYRDLDALAEVALPAVRALVSIAVRALAASPTPVTLPQYRLLVTLSSDGPVRSSALAELLGVDASTVTRMCDRLLRDGLIVRRAEPSDRRALRIALSAKGEQSVAAVTARRRQEFALLLEAIPPPRRPGVIAALRELQAASESRPRADSPHLAWIA
jgi:DNA-binding MarR family transcriptional regulator